MARKKGSANLAASLEVLAGAPLDARTVVASKADLMTASTYPYFYIGMPVYVEAESKMYVLTGSDPTVETNWKELGSGGGGGGSSSAVYTATLQASGWNATTKKQTVTFTGYNGTDNGMIGVPTSATAAQKDAYCSAGINVDSQSTNQFTLVAKTVPSVDLPVILVTV